jgi:hypothetical protein
MYFDGSRVRLGMLISLLTLVITVGLIFTLRLRTSTLTPPHHP